MDRCLILISESNLINNIAEIKRVVNKKIIAVIKANAYGHGDYIVASVIDAYVDMFAVATIKEAHRLRAHGIIKPILILGIITKIDYPICVAQDFSFIVANHSGLRDIKSDYRKYNNLKFHLKIDTGMHRLGFNVEEALEIITELNNLNIEVEGVMTHFATGADDILNLNTQNQLFRQIIDKFNFTYVHSSSSHSFNQFRENATRIGISLYGLGDNSYHLKLKPVLKMVAPVIRCEEVEKDTPVGYGANYRTVKTGYIVTVAFGYGDGFRRNDFIHSYHNGDKLEPISNSCMDYTIYFSEKHIDENEMVEIIGENISVKEIAIKLNTIDYEVTTTLNNRIRRKLE